MRCGLCGYEWREASRCGNCGRITNDVDLARVTAERDALRGALRICVYEVGLADEDGAAQAEEIARAALKQGD